MSAGLCGARPTLLLALASAGAGVILGTLTGLVAGYAGGEVDESLMRLMDALMSFPALILAMLVVVMLGSKSVNVVLAWQWFSGRDRPGLSAARSLNWHGGIRRGCMFAG